MTRLFQQYVAVGATALMLTAGSALFSSEAMAQRGGHGGGHGGGRGGFHGGGFHGGRGFGGRGFGGRGFGGGYGYRGGFRGGYGGYYGGYRCGPIRLAAGLCGPYGY